MDDFSDWLISQNEDYYIQTGHEFDDNQIDWMEAIYSEYNEDGYINWEDHEMYDSAWYYYMSEVIGLDDEDIERYA